MKCKNCKHLGRKSMVENDDCEDVDSGFRECNAMYKEGGLMPDSSELAGMKDSKALVASSGSGMEAFLVREDFCCALFEEVDNLKNALKLYYFTPHGHGQFSFFVTASSKDEAKALISKKIEWALVNDKYFSDYNCYGWGNDDCYDITVVDIGEALYHDNE